MMCLMSSITNTLTNMKINALILVFCLFLFSCQKEFNNIGEFLQWIEEPENGLVKEKNINGFKIKMKYLPPEYLVSQELSYSEKHDQQDIVSIYSYYSNNRTFLLSITHPIERGTNPDIIISSSDNYSDYAGKYMNLSFGLNSIIKINGENNVYHPILASMEQTTSIKGGRTFYIVFADVNETDELLKEEMLDIVFDDEIFNTGISHFRFSKKDIDNIPDFKFINVTNEL